MCYCGWLYVSPVRRYKGLKKYTRTWWQGRGRTVEAVYCTAEESANRSLIFSKKLLGGKKNLGKTETETERLNGKLGPTIHPVEGQWCVLVPNRRGTGVKKPRRNIIVFYLWPQKIRRMMSQLLQCHNNKRRFANMLFFNWILLSSRRSLPPPPQFWQTARRHSNSERPLARALRLRHMRQYATRMRVDTSHSRTLIHHAPLRLNNNPFSLFPIICAQ